MLVSSIIAIVGIGLAWYFFVRRPAAADAVAASAAPLHRLLLHKYYVDEMYDAAIVRPIKRLSTGFLWKGVDAGLIDGAVNGTGAFVGGGQLRAAPVADRLGARLCRLAVRRRGHGARLLHVALLTAARKGV